MYVSKTETCVYKSFKLTLEKAPIFAFFIKSRGHVVNNFRYVWAVKYGGPGGRDLSPQDSISIPQESVSVSQGISLGLSGTQSRSLRNQSQSLRNQSQSLKESVSVSQERNLDPSGISLSLSGISLSLSGTDLHPSANCSVSQEQFLRRSGMCWSLKSTVSGLLILTQEQILYQDS